MKIRNSILTLLAGSVFISYSSAIALEIEAAELAEISLHEETERLATAEVGQHVRFLIVKKSQNPQNLMAFYSRLAEDCSFLQNPERPGHAIFDFYWLMNGTDYKPVHSMIKAEIFKRLQASPSQSPNKFTVAVNDLSRVANDIPQENWKIDVVSAKGSKGCTVKAMMTFGTSVGSPRVHLKEIYSDASANPITRTVKVRSLKLTGVNVKTGQPVSQTFKGR